MPQPPDYARRADYGARILVVDDDPVTRRSLAALLERQHYQVQTAASGPEALAMLDRQRPHLALLDILMPGLSGVETCRQIRAMPGWEGLPVIFLTADERPETYAEAFRARGDDFLRKPVLPSELVVRIRSLLRLKRLQAEVQDERDALLEAQKQKEQLVEFIVHDLKNPLATLHLGLDLLSQSGLPLPAAQQLQRLQETTRSMSNMVQNILDIGRAEQVGLELKRSRLRVPDWLPGLLQEVEFQAQHHQQALTWDCPPDLEVEADPVLLRRLLLNLLDNALKYSPPRSTVRVEAGPIDNGVFMKVVDQGRGIPGEMADAIFDKFTRIQGEDSLARPGYGLGLTFCRLVAEAHGGRIWVENNQPHGSAFILELQAYDPSRHSVAALG
jgi:signal transduction histidine kinase